MKRSALAAVLTIIVITIAMIILIAVAIASQSTLLISLAYGITIGMFLSGISFIFSGVRNFMRYRKNKKDIAPEDQQFINEISSSITKLVDRIDNNANVRS
jgi:hypothetical protein